MKKIRIETPKSTVTLTTDLKAARKARYAELKEVFTDLVKLEKAQETEQQRTARLQAKAIKRLKASSVNPDLVDAISEVIFACEKLSEVRFFSNTIAASYGFSEAEVAAAMDVLSKVVKEPAKQEFYSVFQLSWDHVQSPAEVAAMDKIKALGVSEALPILRKMVEMEKMALNMGTPMRVIHKPTTIVTLGMSQGADAIGEKAGGISNKTFLMDFESEPHPIWSEEDAQDIKQEWFYFAEQLRALRIKRMERHGILLGTKLLKHRFSSTSGLKKFSGYLFDATIDFNRFLCGLTVEQINAHGGILPTKLHQLYSRFWTPGIASSKIVEGGMHMRDAVICGDIKTAIEGDVRAVFPSPDNRSYLWEDRHQSVNMNMFDGQGLMDSAKWGNHVWQCRPFKGILAGVNFDRMAEVSGAPANWKAHVVGFRKEVHDLVKENKTVILTVSQVKDASFWDSEADLIAGYEAAGLDEIWVHEADHAPKAKQRKLSRQMLMSQFDLTTEELESLTGLSRAELRHMKDAEGIRDLLLEVGKAHRSDLARLLAEFPELMELPALQNEALKRYYGEQLDALAGKVSVHGAYLFAVRDPLAMFQTVILGMDISDTKVGLLKAGEVHANTFLPKRLITNRSPHIGYEWLAMNNNRCELADELFGYAGVTFNVRDLADRVLALDFDGDHVLVIDSDTLVKATDRTRAKYGIRPVIFEALPSKASMTVPTDPAAFADWNAECLLNCRRFNKVGEYSRRATAMWNTMSPDMELEVIQNRLVEAAIIACAVNWAVDAAKTYALITMPKALYEAYGESVYSDRFMYTNRNDFVEAMTDKEAGNAWKAAWDEKTVALGDSAPDRAMKLVRQACGRFDVKAMADEDIPDFSRLCNHAKNLNTGIAARPVEGKLLRLIEAYCEIKGVPADNSGKSKTFEQKVFDGDRIGAKELWDYLQHQNAKFWTEWCANEEHDRDSQRKALTEKARCNMLMSIIAEYTHSTNAERDAEWSRQDRIEAFANALVRNRLLSRSFNPNDKKGFWGTMQILRVFADVLRKNVLMHKVDETIKANKSTANRLEEELADMIGEDIPEAEMENLDDIFEDFSDLDFEDEEW